MREKNNNIYRLLATAEFRKLTQADKELFPDATEDALISAVEMGGRNNYWAMVVDKGQMTLCPNGDAEVAYAYPEPRSVDIPIKYPIIYSDEIELSVEEGNGNVDVVVDFQSGKYALYVANEFVADFDLKDDAIAVADDCSQFYSEERVAAHREQHEDSDPDFRMGWALQMEGEHFSACRKFLKAAKRGHLEAQYWVGWIQTEPEWMESDKDYCRPEDDEYPGNFDAGIKWYKIAANNGHHGALSALGDILAERYINPNYEGWGSAADPAEAYMWLRIGGHKKQQELLNQLKKRMEEYEIDMGERLFRIWYEKGSSYRELRIKPRAAIK
jgi:hypothetical protein